MRYRFETYNSDFDCVLCFDCLLVVELSLDKNMVLSANSITGIDVASCIAKGKHYIAKVKLDKYIRNIAKNYIHEHQEEILEIVNKKM